MSVLALPYPWADALLLSGLAVAGLVAGFKRSRWSLALLAVSVIFSAFFVTVGTKLGPVEVVPLALVIGFGARELMVGRGQRVLTVPRPVVLLVAALGVVAAVSSWLAPPGPAGGPGDMQSPSVRPFVQAASYTLSLLFFLVPVWLRVGGREMRTLARGFLAGAGLSAIYGVYQMSAFKLDLPFRGIQYYAEKEGVGLMSVGGTTLFRMSGLSNEPKQLAVISIVAIVMALLARGAFKHPLRRWGVVVVCAVAFVGAWSTGGMWAAVLVLGAGALWMLSSVREAFPRGMKVAVAAAVVVVAVVVLSGQTSEAMNVVRGVTFERVELPGVVHVVGEPPRIENAVIERFLAHPGDLVTGLGLGNYPYVVGNRGQWVWSEGIQPMHSLPLTLLADFGVWGPVALVLGLMGALGAPEARWKLDLSTGGSARRAYTVVVAGLVASILVGVFVSLLPLTLLFMGTLYSFHRHTAARFGRHR